MAIRDNITAYWKMDDASGAIIDETTNFDGTNVGADYGATGKINDAMNFVAGDYIYINGVKQLAIQANGDPFSVNMWVHLDATTGTLYDEHATLQGGFILRITSNKINVWYNTGADHSFPTDYEPTTAGYVMITLTYDGNVIRVYADGEEIGYHDAGNPIRTQTTNDVVIGGDNMDGRIDELGVWSKKLEPAEIVLLYNEGNGLSYPFPEIKDLSKTDPITLTDSVVSISSPSKYLPVSEPLTLTDSVLISSPSKYLPVSDSISFYDVPKVTKRATGFANQNAFLVNNNGEWVEFNHYEYFRVKKRQNQVSEFEVKIYDISTAQKAYFKEQAEVLFFSGTKMILKGKIQTIEYGSSYEVIAQGIGMEASLLNKEFVKSGDNRIQYTNESAQTIAQEINSSILTTASSGLWASDYGDISLRFEYANRLNALGKLTEAIDSNWWVSQVAGSDDYQTDYLNIANQGETSSQRAFSVGSNSTKISQEKDINSLVNYVHALGYGDGINQLSTFCYAASTQSSLLNSNIEATNTTINVIDSSVFDATGTARIADEQITYTGSATNILTGVTRGVNSTARPHHKNCYIEQHYTTASAQAGSSISTYGLMDKSLTDKTIIDRETLEVVASRYLLDRKTPIIRINIESDEPITDAGLNIGDNVTVIDSEADISGDYRIVGQEIESNYGFLKLTSEVSNRSLEFIEQMTKARQDAESMAKYMQGSTNIYAISESENCDDSTDLDMRFFLPNEAVAINKVLLNFKLKDYRAYSKASGSAAHSHAAGGSHTHEINITRLGGDFNSNTPNTSIGFDSNHHLCDGAGFSAIDTGIIIEAETTDARNHTHSAGGSHTHNMAYGIEEEALTSPSVVLKVGPDGGSLTTIDTYETDQIEIDITSAVQAVGAGNWVQIKFEVNKNMRIEANAYIQIFIESK